MPQLHPRIFYLMGLAQSLPFRSLKLNSQLIPWNSQLWGLASVGQQERGAASLGALSRAHGEKSSGCLCCHVEVGRFPRAVLQGHGKERKGSRES